MIKILNKYQNGNVTTTIFSDGTKVREYEDIPKIVHPESIDIKITNYCDLGCNYCHESSSITGEHADISKLLVILRELPAGTEMALGGGNCLSHPNLIQLLQILKDGGIIANITVNQRHLKYYFDILNYLITNNLVKGVGVSIIDNNFKYLKPLLKITDNIVYHLIAGVNDIRIVEELMSLSDNCKILILGYKLFGRGVQYHNESVDNNLKEWYKYLPKIINKCTISFDNLAIEQLKVKRLFTIEGWERFYMGDDFTFTMYIDAVKQEYAPTSRSNNRTSFNECSLFEYFNNKEKIHENKI